jgi:hypothetical protein
VTIAVELAREGMHLSLIAPIRTSRGRSERVSGSTRPSTSTLYQLVYDIRPRHSKPLRRQSHNSTASTVGKSAMPPHGSRFSPP